MKIGAFDPRNWPRTGTAASGEVSETIGTLTPVRFSISRWMTAAAF
ncbi:MAG: hypothetical protein GYA46_14195 [candidate division Zixibacteria bacterium]|nr:hypothetical protein [candidate division Zixibacteria bacterium]